MHSQKTSTLEKLRSKKHEVEFTLHNLHSMHDEEFVHTMRTRPKASSLRDAVVSIPVREENIKLYLDTGVHNSTSKELVLLLKNGDRHKILEFLHSLDDNSFLEALHHPVVREIAETSSALQTRLEAIEAHPFVVPKKRTIKPIHFDLDN